MKFATLDLWIIGIYCLSLIALATWVSKDNGKNKTSEDYFLLEGHCLGGLSGPL